MTDTSMNVANHTQQQIDQATPAHNENKTYGSDSIRVLRGLEAVRVRPVCTLVIPMMVQGCTTWCLKW